MAVSHEFDLVVVGGGAAGITAATEARRRGARTALISQGPVGGECTFTGCVPSKTLLAAAGRGESFASAMATVRDTVQRVAAGDEATLSQAGVDVIRGRATLASPTELAAGDRRLHSHRIILATGADPVVAPIEGLADCDPLTNQSLFELAALPGRLAVLGGGAIGCEMAQAFARLGSDVTIVEAEPRLLPREEPEASAMIADALSADGAKVLTGTHLTGVERGDSVRLHLDAGAAVDADRVLVAVGRRAVTDGLGLAEVGVAVDDHGNIATDDTLATTVAGIWAIGDVTGRMPFTHAAGRMALVAVHNALGGRRPGCDLAVSTRPRSRGSPSPHPKSAGSA